MVRSRFKFILVSLVLLLSLTGIMPLAAQTGSVRLEGIVWDPAGNPLSGVSIIAVETGSGQKTETVSDSDGYYRFLVLPPGIYNVTAKAKGFKDVIHREINLFVPGGIAENLSFEVSAIDKEVGPMDRSRILDSDVADAFTQRDIQTYPLLDRNPLGLAIFQSGIQTNAGNETVSTVSGARISTNSILRDGLSINDPINPVLGGSLFPANLDALSSMQIVTVGGGAEYGASGAQILMTSRSGAKNWTGSVYDYVRNQRMDANDFFKNAQKIGRSDYMRNLFGGVLSGRLNKKTSIFGSYEGNRTNHQVYRNRLVLTDTAKAGIFRWFSPDATTYDSSTVQSFNMFENDPRGLGIDPTVAQILNLMPTGNNTLIGDSSTNNGETFRANTMGYEFYNDTHYNQDRIDARVDYDLNAQHRLFVRFNWDRVNATDLMNNADAAYPGMKSGIYKTNDFNVAFGSNYMLNPKMVNELRVGFFRTATDYERPERSTGMMMYSNIWTDPLNVSSPKSLRYPSFEIADTFSHSRNTHSFKYGFSVRRSRMDSTDYSGVYPTATFNNGNGNTPLVGPDVLTEISSEDRAVFENLYNNLLGRFNSVSQTFQSSRNDVLAAGSPRERKFATLAFSGFVQDSWKIRPNVTLNLGLRYEFNTVPEEKNGYQSVLEQASQISDIANIADFRVRTGDDWYKGSKTNFAPRVGAAWDIFGTGSTVLRGSYGIYYDAMIGSIINLIDQNSYGFSQTVTAYPNENGTDVRLRDGFAVTQPALLPDQPGATRSISIAALNPDLKTPRAQQIQLTLERRWLGMILEAGYTRTRGQKLFQYLNLNQTKISEDFLTSFQELEAYRDKGTPVSASNTLARIFGTPLAAFEALQGVNFDIGRIGAVADTLDRRYYENYQAVGISDFYIRNFPQFDQFIYGTNAAESWYDALRVGIRKTSTNYGFKAYYTWSKSLDTFSSNGASYTSPLDSLNPKASKGFSDFDRKHVLNVAWRYALPFGRNLDEESDMPGWVTALFYGWNVGTLITYESGARFSVISGIENQYGGVYGLADFTRTGGKLGRRYSHEGNVYWIDPTSAGQFSSPDVGRPGTSGRNAFVGPRYFNMDMSLYKNFRFHGTQAIQLRLEAYNIFNNTHFATPDNNLRSPWFGTINSTVGNPRLMQVAFRYQF